MLEDPKKLSRRSVLKATAAAAIPLNFITQKQKPLRCINIVNFIRAVEPREEMDLFEPVQKQMETIKRHGFPATWLLQFDAMVRGPFVDFLKQNMPQNHEVGLWLEMNEEHCKAANVKWRGRPNYEWDWSPPVAFTLGYTPYERIKLVDAAANKFKELWGDYPKSVASWNLDSLTISHFVEKYGVQAFAVCRDQIATDGFTIWGAPIAGYFPSKTNCWSPAVNKENQINAPILRMLGQDPVYYYQREYPLENGKLETAPDTMEPAWPSGQTPIFVERFLEMIAQNPTGEFAYAQLGQENSFGWPSMAKGYELQMNALAKLKGASIETMGQTGRRFKKRFSQTPIQCQVQLKDPFSHTNPAEKTVWYQSRFYRANLHFKGDTAYFRDITVYSDEFEQPFLRTPTREPNVEQRMPAIIDGYHWKGSGRFKRDCNEVKSSAPRLTENRNSLTLDCGDYRVRFEEEKITIKGDVSLNSEWDSSKAAFLKLEGDVARYQFNGFKYGVRVEEGTPEISVNGWSVKPRGGVIVLNLR